MKSIVVDSSSIISLSNNCLLWTMHKLKEKSDVHWIISEQVRKETVDRAIQIPRFRLVGTRVLRNITNNTIEVISKPEITETSNMILDLANSVYTTSRGNFNVIQGADSEVMAIAHNLGSKALLTDERIMRVLIEDPLGLQRILSSRLHTDVEFNSDNYKRLKGMISDILVLRSAEVIAIAYDMGIYDDFIDVAGQEAKLNFLSGMLWGLKLSGCAMRPEEINEYIAMLRGNA